MSFSAGPPPEPQGRDFLMAVPSWAIPAAIASVVTALVGVGAVFAFSGWPGDGDSGDVLQVLRSDQNMPEAQLWRDFSDERLLGMADQVCRVYEESLPTIDAAEFDGARLHLIRAWSDYVPEFSGASRDAQVRDLHWAALEHHCPQETFEAVSEYNERAADDLLREAESSQQTQPTEAAEREPQRPMETMPERVRRGMDGMWANRTEDEIAIICSQLARSPEGLWYDVSEGFTEGELAPTRDEFLDFMYFHCARDWAGQN